MLNGKRRDQWEHTAAINHINANVHRGPKSSEIPIQKFNPYYVKPKQKATPESMAAVKEIFTRMANRNQ